CWALSSLYLFPVHSCSFSAVPLVPPDLSFLRSKTAPKYFRAFRDDRTASHAHQRTLNGQAGGLSQLAGGMLPQGDVHVDLLAGVPVKRIEKQGECGLFRAEARAKLPSG